MYIKFRIYIKFEVNSLFIIYSLSILLKYALISSAKDGPPYDTKDRFQRRQLQTRDGLPTEHQFQKGCDTGT